jgi:hypothetical protein
MRPPPGIPLALMKERVSDVPGEPIRARLQVKSQGAPIEVGSARRMRAGACGGQHRAELEGERGTHGVGWGVGGVQDNGRGEEEGRRQPPPFVCP